MKPNKIKAEKNKNELIWTGLMFIIIGIMLGRNGIAAFLFGIVSIIFGLINEKRRKEQKIKGLKIRTLIIIFIISMSLGSILMLFGTSSQGLHLPSGWTLKSKAEYVNTIRYVVTPLNGKDIIIDERTFIGNLDQKAQIQSCWMEINSYIGRDILQECTQEGNIIYGYIQYQGNYIYIIAGKNTFDITSPENITKYKNELFSIVHNSN